MTALNVESFQYDNTYQNKQQGNYQQIPSYRENYNGYQPNEYETNRYKINPSRNGIVQWIPIEVPELVSAPQGLPGQPGPQGQGGIPGNKINFR